MRLFRKERLKRLKQKYTVILPTNIDILQDFTDGYNHIVHSTIYMPPEDVTKDNEETVRISTFLTDQKEDPVKVKHLRYRFKIGDRVHLTQLRNIFTRQYDERWTKEIFTIAQRFWRQSVPVYRIKDYNGEDILGTFYQSELQKITVTDTDLWRMENVPKTK